VFHPRRTKLDKDVKQRIRHLAGSQHLSVDFPRQNGCGDPPLMVFNHHKKLRHGRPVAECEVRGIVATFANKIFPAPAASTSKQVVAA
jgi:hypothetical protein